MNLMEVLGDVDVKRLYYLVEILRVPIRLSLHSKYLVCTEYGKRGLYLPMLS